MKQALSTIDLLANWGFLVEHWDTAPTLNKNITGGAVYNYTYRGVTRYRFVPTTYSAASDSFYAGFDSGTDTLSGLIVSRGV